jgi:Peptidase family M23
MPRRPRTTARSIFLTLLTAWVFAGTADAAVPERILFPVVAKTSYTDDFGAPRGSRSHQGNDIMAARWSAVVAVERGRIEKPSWAQTECMLILHGRSGTDYWYLHLNNDLTSSNDNRGGCRNGVSYAAGLRTGQTVRAGQLIGYVGNSGNANWTSPHLHFELHPGGGNAISPYKWLRGGWRVLFPGPADATKTTRLRLRGKARSADADSFSTSVTYARVSVSGWIGKPARGVTVSLNSGTAVYRETQNGSQRARLASMIPGETVTVWTTYFLPTRRAQIAAPDVLTARRILLRGT